MVWVSRVARAARGRGSGSRFTDSLRLHVKGGAGGAGLPRYGGRGGQGGCVYCVGAERATLKLVQGRLRAGNAHAGPGADSSRLRVLGAPGRDVQLEVPLGVTAYGEGGELLGSVDEEGQTVIVARGGPGGGPDNGYLGRAGQNRHVRLDLRLIADVGLVGFPNAGKSSLLRAVSKARPRVASYPFTTLRPNIGVMEFRDLRQITVADLPGLIEGAHVNVGLGHQFLKHVERTKLLLLVADVNGFKLSPKHEERSCLETVLLLNKELELYNEDLLLKPAMLVINKMDSDGASDAFKRIKESILNLEKTISTLPDEIRPEKLINFEDILGISALRRGDDIHNLKDLIRKRLDEYADSTNPDIIDVADLFRKNNAMVQEHGPQVT